MKCFSVKLFLLAVSVLPNCSTAQTITVRVLNAKSGKPFLHQNVTIRWDGGKFEEQALDSTGQARFAVLAPTAIFIVTPGPRNGKEPYRIAYRNCNNPLSRPFVAQEVLKQGFRLDNTCGKADRSALPGEVIFWALPRPRIDWQ